MDARKPIIGVIVLLVVVCIAASFYIVDETEQAVITFFGEPVTIILGSLPPDLRGDFDKDIKVYEAEKGTKLTTKQGAGLYMKIPFLQKVIHLEDRILEYDSPPTDIVTKDKKHLMVDNFARWRIVNPLRFLQTVRTEHGAQSRLDDIIYSVLREELAMSDLVEIVRTDNTIPALEEQITTGREVIMKTVAEKADKAAIRYGIQLIDVRIKRADLPQENLNAIFGRMVAERSRISKRYRSEGEEEAVKIRAQTDKEVKIILADAYKMAETTKGRGDGRAAAIYADAYSSYEDFYKFGGVYKYLK